MKEILLSYIHAFIHPFHFHAYLRHSIPIPGHEFDKLRGLDFSETILCSWCFYILKSITELTMLFLAGGFFLGALESLPEEYRSLLLERVSTQRIIVFYITFRVVFFPALIAFKVWARRWFLYMASVFFAESSEEEGLDEKIDNVIKVSLTSYFPGFIPIFGDFVQTISEYVLLFAGYRQSFGLGRIASFILLFFPQIFVIILIATGLIITLGVRTFIV